MQILCLQRRLPGSNLVVRQIKTSSFLLTNELVFVIKVLPDPLIQALKGINMRPGFPACEGEGSELVATHITIRVKNCPMIVLNAKGQKMYVLAYGEGSLILADEAFLADALELLDQVSDEINSDHQAGEGWSAIHQTSASFRAWATAVVEKWQTLQ